MKEKEFWRHFGIETPQGWTWIGDKEQTYIDYPPITLDNLFKYCIPKLNCNIEFCKVWKDKTHTGYYEWSVLIEVAGSQCCSYIDTDKDPEQALYKAICEAIKENEES